jgi:peptidoglycan/xylan/chitin deacetylase (PgdA/CDA1 family)
MEFNSNKNKISILMSVAVVAFILLAGYIASMAYPVQINTQPPPSVLGVLAKQEAASLKLELYNYRIKAGELPDNFGHPDKLYKIIAASDWQNYSLAFFEIDIYSEKLSDDLAKLNAKIAQAEIDRIKAYKQEAPKAVNKTIQLPILLYHKTPGNFAAQLDALVAKGYTTISMAQLENYFDGLGQLPAKPVVITFDDGFSDQSAALSLLLQKNMKATFYIVVGGEKSGWCVGAMRRPQNCGDSYLDWAQIREMTKSGLIEIGAHTINHANLAGLSPADQTREIVDSKTIIEKELGVKITTFAYPYGRYSQATIDIALKAGFKSAVTTVSGLSQSSANRLTLTRVRDALLLP